MSALFRLFTIARPQRIAAALLLIFLLECLYVANNRPLDQHETDTAFAGRRLWSANHLGRDWQPNFDESILAVRAVGALPALMEMVDADGSSTRVYASPDRLLARLPFILFGLWLGGALWWVARRLYGNEGGYVALALYCFSPAIILFSSRVRSDILVAWGVFGLIFTAIGVAHTLYAPPRMWKVRILILGAALGITAAANFVAALIALIFAVVFVLYLAPGRRLTGMAVLALSCAFGLLVCWVVYGFRLGLLNHFRIALDIDTKQLTRYALHPSSWIFTSAFVLSIVVYFLWPRARYFGNTAPLIVGCVLLLVLPGGYLNGSGNALQFALWGLPFVCVFIGGIFADLLEDRFFGGRYRLPLRMLEVLLLVANAALCLMAIHQGVRPWLEI
ncbi:MAG TPA: hypothetical protein VF493_03055 [Terriglobales bacterium]